MPMKPKVPCKHPGCAALVPFGTKEVRSAASRGYGAAWQKASREFLRAHPLCEECMKRGKYVKATVVDHIVPHRGDEALFWDRSNWRPLCKRCHDRKTRREDQTPTYHY